MKKNKSDNIIFIEEPKRKNVLLECVSREIES